MEERRKVQEIIAYSNGDSNEISTWSNVPYLCLKAMQSKGIKIDRVDIAVENKGYVVPVLRDVFNLLTDRLSHIFSSAKKTMVKFDRTMTHEGMVKKEVKKAQKKYPGAEIQLVFDFSHAYKSNIPTVCFCDWTIEYEIEEHQLRSPGYFEKKIIKRQFKNLENADAIITLFPYAYEKIRHLFPEKTYYLGHIINVYDIGETEQYSYDKTKCNSQRVLFIGKKKYINGLQVLIEAVNFYNQKNSKSKIYLDIIGMEENDFPEMDISTCTFYGYLDKNNGDDRKKYYSLMKNAKCMVNITKQWNGASSIIEALWCGTPVIISRNKDIEGILGDDKEFGKWCEPEKPQELVECLEYIMNMSMEEYQELTQKAHRKVKDYTWDKYSEKMIKVMETVLERRK